MEPRQIFARNLRRLRVEKEFSQEGLGAACGLHRTEVGLLERGQRDPQLNTLVRLARGLAVPVGDLLEGIA